MGLIDIYINTFLHPNMWYLFSHAIVRRLILSLFYWLIFSILSAQNVNSIYGNLVDSLTQKSIEHATVQLLSISEKKFIAGTTSDKNGYFKIDVPHKDNYLIKVSFVGYKPKEINVSLKDNKSKNIGVISLIDDAVMLGEAVIIAQAPPVKSIGDTLVFNASVYSVTAGASLEELVEKMPGIEIEEDNKVKLNGKNVKKININGKEFFGGDIEVALKNLPADMIEEIKSYDKQSDMEKMTGIDDGEDELILDITIKKNKNRGFFGNSDLSVGTKDRYSSKLMTNNFSESTQLSFIASANNVNSKGFRGGAKEKWETNRGITAAKNIGANIAFENKIVEFDGSIDYRVKDNNYYGINSTQRFLTNKTTFSNANNLSDSKSESLRGSFRFQWKINPKTTLLFRPNFNFSNDHGDQNNISSQFNEDPLKWVDNPNNYLSPSEYEQADENAEHVSANINSLEKSRINSSKSKNISFSKKNSFSSSILLNRKLNDKGRNIGLRLGYGYNDNRTERLNNQITTYYRMKDQYGNDSTFLKNYFIPVNTNSYNYSAQINYSEPIAKGTFFQVSYQFLYKNNVSDRKTYNFLSIPEWNINESLPQDYEDLEVTNLSKSAKYDYFNHNISTTLRMVRPKYNISLGLSLQPQHTVLSYQKGENEINTSRSVFNYAPQISIRYNFTKNKVFRFSYNGRSSQPSMEQLLPISDDTNPLNIKVGNPNLLPSFSHDIRFNYNSYNSKYQRTIAFNTNFSMVQNSLTNSTIYNSETGGQIVTPQNINGDWNGTCTFVFNSALRNKRFHINSNSTVGYNNNVGFIYNKSEKTDLRNRITNLRLNQRLGVSYRNSWLEVGVNGSILYSFEKNKILPINNQEPYLYSYGTSFSFKIPWDMSINTNIVSQQRCGYSDKTLNRNEIVWNAQISQSFFKGSAILSLEMYDILHQKSNISRNLTANLRSVIMYNSINSYAMLHFIYKLNIMGGKHMKISNKKMKINNKKKNN